MDGPYNTHERDEKCMQNFISKLEGERDHMRLLDGKIILNKILKVYGVSMWIVADRR
jgi:hypothetical protein